MVTTLVKGALVLVVIAGGIAWGIVITHRGYTYDEVQRAHSIWMTSQGLRPYHDFFECHPPYFALLAPLVSSHKDPATLPVTLRWVVAAGNLLFLIGLATVASMSGGSRRLAAILGTALVAFHPAMLLFLAEFRIDGWGYALAIWSIVWFLRSRHPWRHIWFGIGTGIATLLFCPKLALLPPMIFVFEQVRVRSSLRDALRAFVMYATGCGVASGLFWLWLLANGLDSKLVFAYLVRYHSLSNFHSAFGRGLLREIAKLPILSVPLLLAIAVWLIRCIRAKSLPAAYPAALALWLVAQAVLVSYPYRQYYGPWFLFASGFFPFLYSALDNFPKRAATTVFFGLCVLSISVSVATANTWANYSELPDQQSLVRILNRVTNPEDRVVAMPPIHPIYRRDTFYVWFKTIDPSGFETEEIMETIPLVRHFVSEQHYRDELTAHSPALVVFWRDSYPRRQNTVLSEFLREHGYVSSAIGNLPVAVHPDRFEQFQRNRPAK